MLSVTSQIEVLISKIKDHVSAVKAKKSKKSQINEE